MEIRHRVVGFEELVREVRPRASRASSAPERRRVADWRPVFLTDLPREPQPTSRLAGGHNGN